MIGVQDVKTNQCILCSVLTDYLSVVSIQETNGPYVSRFKKAVALSKSIYVCLECFVSCGGEDLLFEDNDSKLDWCNECNTGHGSIISIFNYTSRRRALYCLSCAEIILGKDWMFSE